MPIAYFIVAGLAALFFLATGLAKLSSPKDRLLARGMDFAEDFATWQVKLIGTAEVLGAIGLIVPMATSIAPIVSPIAGVCLALLMVAAIVVHVRRGDAPTKSMPTAIALALAAASAVLGFLTLV